MTFYIDQCLFLFSVAFWGVKLIGVISNTYNILFIIFIIAGSNIEFSTAHLKPV